MIKTFPVLNITGNVIEGRVYTTSYIFCIKTSYIWPENRSFSLTRLKYLKKLAEGRKDCCARGAKKKIGKYTMVNARRTIGKHYPKSHTKYFDNLKYDVSWGGGAWGVTWGMVRGKTVRTSTAHTAKFSPVVTVFFLFRCRFSSVVIPTKYFNRNRDECIFREAWCNIDIQRMHPRV